MLKRRERQKCKSDDAKYYGTRVTVFQAKTKYESINLAAHVNNIHLA